MDQEPNDKQAQHADEPAVESDGTPRFGRLLLLLAFSILIIVLLTWGSEAYYTAK